MRTTKNPPDIAYNAIGSFGITLDSCLGDRELSDAFNELMRKAAARYGNMAWLTADSFNGSLLPRDRISKFMLRAPEVGSNELPK